MVSNDLRPSQTGEEGVTLPVLERPPALVQYLAAGENAIRRRLAKLRLFERVFLPGATG